MKTKKLIILSLLIFISSFSFANESERKYFIGINGTGLNVIGIIFEYSFGNSFSIISEIHFNNPIGAEIGINIYGRYYFFENMNKLYLDLGFGYFGNFVKTNCLMLEPRIGWRFFLGDSSFALEPHLGYPFILPINKQYDLPYSPDIYSIYGIFGIIAGFQF
ncbi:MAG: hypothetical protein LBI28_14460 [Treponema sp.]|jgi:hypothetical protein|nr:hypothetical protein [Treponema sp.]